MKPKFIKEREDYIRRMKKGGVEATVHAILKPKHSWEVGLTFPQICTQVRESRMKRVGDARVRKALSLHNKYGKMFGIYIRCEFGWALLGERKEKEYRYFVPKEQEDINREHSKLEHIKDISNLKEGNLTEYEIKTIPEEKQLEAINPVSEM